MGGHLWSLMNVMHPNIPAAPQLSALLLTPRPIGPRQIGPPLSEVWAEGTLKANVTPLPPQVMLLASWHRRSQPSGSTPGRLSIFFASQRRPADCACPPPTLLTCPLPASESPSPAGSWPDKPGRKGECDFMPAPHFGVRKWGS